MKQMKDATTGNIPDTEIIHRILHGEKELYAIIIRKYNQRLYRVGMSVLNDDAETEEAMQVAYIKAYENLGKFEFRSQFSTWLTRILINESLLRKKKRREAVQIQGDIADMEQSPQHTIDHQTPAFKMMNAELKSILEKAISNLPEKYRTVFVMREIEQMNVAETQDCLDLSEANVKVRLNRAKSLLKNSLESFYSKEELFHFHLSRCNKMVDQVLDKI